MPKLEIIPAILPKDIGEIREKTELINGMVKTVQIDICDGHFVSSFTWPYKKHDDTFEKMLKEEEGLPYWESLDYEFDLMINNPLDLVDDWVSIGSKRLIIHIESKGDIEKTINSLIGRVEIGLALNITTSIDTLSKLIDKVGISNIESIQLMGIERIGFQGQKFDTRVLDKIREIRNLYKDINISVDGGVSLENAPDPIDAGANRLVVGSAIWNSDNIIDTIDRLKAIINN